VSSGQRGSEVTSLMITADCEPLLADVEAVARLEECLLPEAHGIYEDRFAAGTGPED
jgi:hypothetical protein